MIRDAAARALTALHTHWRQHGTKILGYGSIAIGTLEAVDRETANYVGEFFGPKYGPHVSHLLLVIGGLAVAHRGYKNSQTIKSNLSPPPTDTQ